MTSGPSRAPQRPCAEQRWFARAALAALALSLLGLTGCSSYAWAMFRENMLKPTLFQMLGGKELMPIHWRTFIQSPRAVEPTFSPIQRLRAAAGDKQLQIVGDDPGKVVTVSPAP